MVSVVAQLDGRADAAVAAVRDQPVLAGAVVCLVVLLALAGWLIWRYLRRSPAARLRAVIADYEEIAVLMHPNPDPDAMSCSLAVAELADAVDTTATMVYPGEIRRPENRAFETVLDLEFERIESAEGIDVDSVVLVDHNEPRGFPGAETIDPVAVVDHHPGDGTGSRFTDVRTEDGACATIFAEYFDELDWEFYEVETGVGNGTFDGTDVPDGALPTHVATGMLYGIQSDTRSLTNGCSPADFEAASFLYQGVDGDLLNRIANPQVDAEVLDVKARAVTNRVVRAPYAYSDVGEVSNTDAIPQAADELETLEGVSAVVVVGESDGTLRLAGRSRDDRVHIGRAIESVLDDIPMAEGGGHARMGGGQLSVDHLNGIGPSNGVSREELRERLFDVMSGER
ncbi:DHH family phosphoesterase [Haloarcula pelagica]|uniref:DHH family phosphoesterase n=1 Tax=Haloarcula pelagica TaxID=3033389 RepID=UPI0024C3F0D3|nr:DHHA1 domain-containing protein [Halomicroarcula sp. YJ-61-S]